MALDEEKLLIAKIDDLYKKCDKYATAAFSAFLDSAAQAVVSEKCLNCAGYNLKMFGGFEEAERKIFGVFNEWEEADESRFPISVLSIKCKGAAKLAHRDYLGAVLSLGIDRCKVGDILVDDTGAVVFAADDIAEYIKNNISKIGRCGVEVGVCAVKEAQIPERRFEVINTVAASERLDAVVAAALNMSRGSAAAAIESAKVQVNHRICESTSHKLRVGDLISVRGFGRVLLEDMGGVTRKGRLHITLKKFI